MLEIEGATDKTLSHQEEMAILSHVMSQIGRYNWLIKQIVAGNPVGVDTLGITGDEPDIRKAVEDAITERMEQEVAAKAANRTLQK